MTPYEQGFITKLAQLRRAGAATLSPAYKANAIRQAAGGRLINPAGGMTEAAGSAYNTAELAGMARRGLGAARKHFPKVVRYSPKVSRVLKTTGKAAPLAWGLSMVSEGADIISKNPETGISTFGGMLGPNQAANARAYTKNMFNTTMGRQSAAGGVKGLLSPMGSINAFANTGLEAAQAGAAAAQSKKFVDTRRGWDSYRGAQKWYERQGYTPAQAGAKAKPQRPLTGNLESTPWWAKRWF